MTLAVLSIKSGIPLKTLSSAESGRIIHLSTEATRRLSDILGVVVSDIGDRREKFIKESIKLEYIGEVEGGYEDALEYGRNNVDVGLGCLYVISADAELPDMTPWAEFSLYTRYGAAESEVNIRVSRKLRYSNMLAGIKRQPKITIKEGC
jgi:hypothetical protein